MPHRLKLYVRDNVVDTRYLIVSDISHYDPSLAVTNLSLYVQVPGFNTAVLVPFTKGATQSYTGVHLENCAPDEITELPDGLYTFSLSVAPNQQVFSVLYYFRTAILEKQISSRIAALFKGKDPHYVDDCGNIELEKETNILLACQLAVTSMKANLATYNDYDAASQLYHQTQGMLSLLNKMENV